jgi:hypothetical protein
MNGGLDRQAHAQELSQRLPGVTTILTGSRCTILVKLPVALLGAAAPHSSLAIYVLGRGHLRLPADADLYGHQLSGIQGQGPRDSGTLRFPPAVRIKSNLGF